MRKTGFTLIEVLIAVLILAMAVAAAAIVERTSLRSDSLHRHRFQATGLAQQGLNLARSIRDTNVTSDDGIWTNLGDADPDPNQAYFLDLVDGKWILKEKSAGEDITLDGIKYNRKIYIENSRPGGSEIVIEKPVDLLYLLDLSNSMNENYPPSGSKLQSVKDAIYQFNNVLIEESSNSRVALLTFYGGSTFFCNTSTDVRVVLPFGNDISTFNNILSGLSASGSTPAAEAINLANSWSKNPPNQWLADHLPVVIFLSDGVPTVALDGDGFQDWTVERISLYDANNNFLAPDIIRQTGNQNCGHRAGETLADTMEAINNLHTDQPNVSVYSIAVQSGIFNKDILEYVASTGGGQSYEAVNASMLADVLREILSEVVSTQYYSKKVKTVITWEEYGKTQTLELWTYLKDVE